MKNKLLTITATLLLSLGFLMGYAQEATNATGGDASGSGGTAPYSIGQVFYSTQTGSNGSVAQGVQHAYEIFSVGIENTELGISLNVFPNPTVDNLTLEIEDFQPTKMKYQLYDMQGRMLGGGKIRESQTQINVSALPAATYFLYVQNENHRVHTFKIIKN